MWRVPPPLRTLHIARFDLGVLLGALSCTGARGPLEEHVSLKRLKFVHQLLRLFKSPLKLGSYCLKYDCSSNFVGRWDLSYKEDIPSAILMRFHVTVEDFPLARMSS